MTLLSLTLCAAAIAGSVSAMALLRDGAPAASTAAVRTAQPVFHPPAIDLGRLAQACGRLG